MKRENIFLEAFRPEITRCLSIAWFPKRSEVPCQNAIEQKTVDGGDITVEWQWKSQAFMEIVQLKDFSIEFDRENVKNFDLVGR
jgi:hypothetical protein